jgi:hypothetical protein
VKTSAKSPNTSPFLTLISPTFKVDGAMFLALTNSSKLNFLQLDAIYES